MDFDNRRLIIDKTYSEYYNYDTGKKCREADTTTLLDAGVPLAEVSQRLGHSKVSTTLDSYYKSKNQNNDAYMAAINHARPFNPQENPQIGHF
ncbi:MAG: hypothetical protein LUF27_02875 [Lachnospiraceae bacterium]|nr:hypothetical protein [Lachnospiraceae bacterium]